MWQRTQLLMGAGALLLSLAACSHVENGPEQAFDINNRFPITVEPHMEALRLPYEGTRTGLASSQDTELKRFVKDYLEAGSGAIAISAPKRFPNAPAIMAERLAALGVPRERILVGNDDGVDGRDDIKITYIRYEARTPECGDWSTNLGKTFDNQVSPNFGCATQHNIAAMVADPRDLVAPKPLDPDDAQRRLTVLEKYRKGEATVAQKAQEQNSTITQVGGGGGGM